MDTLYEVKYRVFRRGNMFTPHVAHAPYTYMVYNIAIPWSLVLDGFRFLHHFPHKFPPKAAPLSVKYGVSTYAIPHKQTNECSFCIGILSQASWPPTSTIRVGPFLNFLFSHTCPTLCKHEGAGYAFENREERAEKCGFEELRNRIGYPLCIWLQ